MGSRWDQLSPAERILYYSLEFLDRMLCQLLRLWIIYVKGSKVKAKRCEQQNGIFVADVRRAPPTVQ